jgi:hypothetical protein
VKYALLSFTCAVVAYAHALRGVYVLLRLVHVMQTRNARCKDELLRTATLCLPCCRAYIHTLTLPRHAYTHFCIHFVLRIRFEYDNNGEVAAAMVRTLVLIYEAGKGAEFSSEHSAERSAEDSAGDLSTQPTATININSSSSSSDSEQQHVLELLAALDSLMQPRPARPDVSSTSGDSSGTASTSEYSDASRGRGRSNGTGNTNVVSVLPV